MVVSQKLMINKRIDIIYYLITIIVFISSISHAQFSIQGKVISVADGGPSLNLKSVIIKYGYSDKKILQERLDSIQIQACWECV